MNKKIQKYLNEIEKSEKKIEELQQYIKEIRIALKKEEDMEMVRSIRGMNLDREGLFQLLEGLQNGSVSFRRDSEKDAADKTASKSVGTTAGGINETEKEIRKGYDDGEMEKKE